MKGVVLAIVFFALGVMLSPYIPVSAEDRLAESDIVVDSAQRVDFDSIAVYPDGVRINEPDLHYAQVSSNSMAPIITDKSTVFEKTPDSPYEIKVGDVISFYEPSRDAVVLHMVVEILYIDGSVYYRTMGVANDFVDPWLVSYDNVKGIMVGTFR